MGRQHAKPFLAATVVLRPFHERLPSFLERLYATRMQTRGMSIVQSMFRGSAFSAADVEYTRKRLYIRGQLNLRQLRKVVETELTTKAAIKRAFHELVTEILYSGPDTWMEGNIEMLAAEETGDRAIELTFDEDKVSVQL